MLSVGTTSASSSKSSRAQWPLSSVARSSLADTLTSARANAAPLQPSTRRTASCGKKSPSTCSTWLHDTDSNVSPLTASATPGFSTSAPRTGTLRIQRLRPLVAPAMGRNVVPTRAAAPQLPRLAPRRPRSCGCISASAGVAAAAAGVAQIASITSSGAAADMMTTVTPAAVPMRAAVSLVAMPPVPHCEPSPSEVSTSRLVMSRTS
mmetsp:Transcript_3879/g.11039  ORF Transcript_3879/g.11039 Transcript_3879/m.11039 type:complete len:207 (-) Transcript_3879:1029-1649(-)